MTIQSLTPNRHNQRNHDTFPDSPKGVHCVNPSRSTEKAHHSLRRCRYLLFRPLGVPRLPPQIVGSRNRIDLLALPPLLLVACVVQFPVMQGAKRHRVFITDLPAHGPWLSKAQMMSVCWATPAYEARLACLISQMPFVPPPRHRDKARLLRLRFFLRLVLGCFRLRGNQN